MKIIQIIAVLIVCVLATQKTGISSTELVGYKELLLCAAISIIAVPQVAHWFD